MEKLALALRSRVWRERMAAIAIIFDRAFGKPPQQIVGADGNSLTLLHLLATKEVGERVIAEIMHRQAGAIIDGDGAAVEVPSALTDLSVPATE